MKNVSKILNSIGQATYTWDMATNRIEWSSNFQELVGLEKTAEIDNALSFEALLSGDSPKTRFAAIHQSMANANGNKSGTFQCVYALKSDALETKSPVWIEDNGRWEVGEDGHLATAQGVVRIINERRNREEKLKQRAEIDELTGLANRSILQQAIDRTISNCQMENGTSTLLLISLCDFERINRVYGFDTGDEILREIAGLLKADLRKGDLAARFSGAKFGIIIRNSGEKQGIVAAKRTFDNLNGKVILSSAGPVSLKVAIGVCVLPRDARNSHDAVAAATGALDKARRSFGSKVARYCPDPDVQIQRERDADLLSRFIDAMERDAMVLAYQPVLTAGSAKPAFYEALLRFEELDHKLVGDSNFLKLAEDLGLMRNLDKKALELVLDVIFSCPDAHLSLNVTHESLEDGAWLSSLQKNLRNRPDCARRMIVELTESHLPNDLEETGQAIRDIQALGCRVAIDDFGAGYTSFSHLRDLGVDLVKIDGSYARELANDDAIETFLKAILEMSHSFQMETVVEWVEDIETAVKLHDWGFTYLQGSLYGMPLRTVPWRREENLPKRAIANSK